MSLDKRTSMNSIRPYNEDKPYIFISYSHKNKDEAVEIISQLQTNHYRVWYDEGIDPGSEWDENIATHINRCGFFIALLSREYLESTNCKDELSYVRNLEKPRLLIYLEDIQLPDGMKMRLNRLQAIHKYRYNEQYLFYEKLYTTSGLISCLDECSEFTHSKVCDLGTSNDHAVTFKISKPDAQIRLICVVDTSSNISGEKIDLLNNGFAQLQASLPNAIEAELAIDILQPASKPQWRTLSDLPLKAGGVANASGTLMALIEYGKQIREDCSCAIVFLCDELSEDTVRQLSHEHWFKKAIKIVLHWDSSKCGKNDTCVAGVCLNEASPFFPIIFRRVAINTIKAAKISHAQTTYIDGYRLLQWLLPTEIMNSKMQIDDKLKWDMKDGTLYIYSSPIIPDFRPMQPTIPWLAYQDTIRKIVFVNGTMIVGTYAFYGLTNLEEIIMSKSISDIRTGAFANCPNLRKIALFNQPIQMNSYKEKGNFEPNTLAIWPGAFENTPWDNVTKVIHEQGTGYIVVNQAKKRRPNHVKKDH